METRQLSSEGESLVKDWLERRGWSVSVAKSTPRLAGEARSEVLPDFRASHPEKGSQWIEVKTYNQYAVNRNIGAKVHGFARDLWLSYRETAKQTGIPVWIFIYEPFSSQILMSEIFEMDAVDCTCPSCQAGSPARCNQTPGGMVYFRRHRFKAVDVRQGALF